MRILGMKPGHDGAIAYADDAKLIYSLEAEKDSFNRYSELSALTFRDAGLLADQLPDVVAIGGWHKSMPGHRSKMLSGYSGVDAVQVSDGNFFGRPVKLFSSSHERSHLFMTAALAPDAPIEECVILVWEGGIGALYHWQDYGRTITRRDVLTQPGARYAALFDLADPTFPHQGSYPRLEDAGKLMALAAYGDAACVSAEAAAGVEALLSCDTLYPFDKQAFQGSALYNCSLDNPLLHHAAQYLSDQLFNHFYTVARTELPTGLPLLISGGCGLNCEWNKRWADCGLYSSVFVPPCTNDSGSAIGTIADAQSHLGGPCKLDWSVYSGMHFQTDMTTSDSDTWTQQPTNLATTARLLAQGQIVAWVQGRYEIGPRALGHRSLLASPLTTKSRDTLNAIKEREHYRPIAPCCLTDELTKWFDNPVVDPYMLYFARVTTDALPAVTHVDKTARIQAVSPDDESSLAPLLREFRELTGYGVLCNTSLNFKGRGFLNTLSELLAYCDIKGIRHAVVDNRWYSRR